MSGTICTEVDRDPGTCEFDHDWVSAVLVEGVWLDVEVGSFDIYHSHQLESPQGLMPDDTFASFCSPVEDPRVTVGTAYRLVMVRLGAISAFKFASAEET